MKRIDSVSIVRFKVEELTVVGLSNKHGGILEVWVVFQIVVGVIPCENKEDAGLEVLQGRV